MARALADKSAARPKVAAMARKKKGGNRIAEAQSDICCMSRADSPRGPMKPHRYAPHTPIQKADRMAAKLMAAMAKRRRGLSGGVKARLRASGASPVASFTGSSRTG